VATTLINNLHLSHLILIHSITMLGASPIQRLISTVAIAKPVSLHPNQRFKSAMLIMKTKVQNK
jgi:hypothetical protein